MTGGAELSAFAGFALALAAAATYGAMVFFGDMFLKDDDQLRRTMDALLWMVVLSLACTSAAAVFGR